MSTCIKGLQIPSHRSQTLNNTSPSIFSNTPASTSTTTTTTMPTTVITGARTGLGLEHVRHLSTSPTNTIYALVRRLSTGDLTALQTLQSTSPATIHILECDTSSPASISSLPALITATSPTPVTIHTLINNAAILHHRTETSLTLSPSAFHAHMSTNVLGPALVLSALLPLLAPDARVVNITSGLGSLELLSNGTIGTEATHYSVSKAALNMMTVHQARQVPKGVVVVCVDPGHAKTEMGGEGATTETGESVRGIWEVIGGVKGEDAGKFYEFRGGVVPW